MSSRFGIYLSGWSSRLDKSLHLQLPVSHEYNQPLSSWPCPGYPVSVHLSHHLFLHEVREDSGTQKPEGKQFQRESEYQQNEKNKQQL